MAEVLAMPLTIHVTARKSMCCKELRKGNHPCKRQQKECNSSSCCLNCPLCYSFTFLSSDKPEKLPSTSSKEYSVFQSSYLFLYYSDVWRPPNGC